MYKHRIVCCLVISINFFLSLQTGYSQTAAPEVINMVFSSDAHYGISRKTFRGDSNVTGTVVNAAMIKEVNSLPNVQVPKDGGVNGGNTVGPIDFMVQTGDIANRMEPPVQSATASWTQFENDYIRGLKVKGHNGLPAKLLLAPGNHDISNAIGFPRPMQPLTDPTSMVSIYNLMMKPAVLLTNQTFDYARDKVNYSFNLKGIHIMFITLWPDSAERIWMTKDLDSVNGKTPVIVFTHDQPTSEAKHFTNPKLPYKITADNTFEDLVSEHYKDGYTAAKDDGATDMEQRGFAAFLKIYPNIKAYFHGNSNWNEYYTYTGPDKDVKLPVFRVDSPMKGKFSAKDEKQLSFQLITLDPQAQNITVRECLWNTMPADPNQKIVFGQSITVSLKVE
ncbi:metallophosphoesterase family protein [Mucilaginibacter flavidus]|uniref:metallophosphoesterase family protein n=1 Tax=Mucilaginibacter flavidus TaxID=2949309 RepID=UPI002092C3C3|nr:metallophosphoesterase [Mucilaginibacter flavidus]MCO5948355.1 metallophosphoesterase [Mucilaginibacter flavidus]